jgi:hypothetical protein
MIVEAEVWHWTAHGMRRGTESGSAYITVRDAEQLLQEAHERGRRAGLAKAMEVINQPVPA